MILTHRLRFACGWAVVAGLAGGCVQQDLKPTEVLIDEVIAEAIAAPVPVAEKPTAPPPVPTETAERFDIDVINAPAAAFFAGLVADTGTNVIVHPDVSGRVSVTLNQVTLDEALEAARAVYGYDIAYLRGGFIVRPASLQNRVFEIDYLNLSRAGISQTRVSSGQVSQSGGDESRSSDGDTVASTNNDDRNRATTGSRIDTVNYADFWSELSATLLAIVGGGEGRNVVTNAHTGVVYVRAMPDELRAVEEYLATIHDASRRQVVLEAKIIEVALDEGFQAGINWAAVGVTADGDTYTGGQLSGGRRAGEELPLGGDELTIGPGNPVRALASETVGGAFVAALDVGDFSAFIELLERQGDTRVLSSPRVATLNNQKAIIKAGSDEFFVTDVSSNTVTGTAATTSRDVTLTPFFSGIALDVTPQISAAGDVILHVHPTVSEVTDQTKELTVSGERDLLPLAVSEVREADSIVRARSGQVIAIGGLMRSSDRELDFAVPVLGDLPGIGRLFRSSRYVRNKTELVILLRPIVVNEADDWPAVVGQATRRLSEVEW